MTLSYCNNITQVYWQPLTTLLDPKGKKRQELAGFDDEFIDIVDYIIRITHRIWEQKNIGLCYDYYGEICPVFTLGAYSERVEDVVQNTLKTVAAFPDRSLIGENVIWKAEADGTYYSSHLITSIMTNTGNSDFGTATNKTGRVTTIADCVCFENKIIKEWLVRDNSFLIAQLGIDLIDAAINFAKLPVNDTFTQWYTSENERVLATDHRQNLPVPNAINFADSNDNTIEHWVNDFVHSWAQTLFNQKQFSTLNNYYHVAAQQQWPGGRQATGLAQINGTIIQWLAQCADAKVTIDHIGTVDFVNEAAPQDETIDVALRWSLSGTFSPREERLVPLKGQKFFVLACSHLRIQNSKIVKEVTVFDEIALYANIIRNSGLTLAHLAQENADV